MNSTANWDSIFQASEKYRVTPLLYHRLKHLGVPAPLMKKLKTAHVANLWINTDLYNELSKILSTLQQAGIPVIVLKGAHLAEKVYSNIALRSMNDLDILIRKTDLFAAEKKLLEMGYSSSRETDIEEVCAEFHQLPALIKPNAAVEIHWTIEYPTSPFKIDVDGLWKRAQATTIAGVETLVLSPEDLLLHLCLHTAFHHIFQFGLRPFYDIWETIRHYNIDWEQVQLRSHEWDANNSIYLALYLAKTSFDANVPNEVLEKLKPASFDPRVESWAKEEILGKFEDIILPPSSVLIQFWKSKHLSEKAGIVLNRLFPYREEMAELYLVPPNSPKIYLYYPVRLINMFRRHSRALWRLLRRDKETVNFSEQQF
ncbi:hypothetical protein THIOM_001494, partial [Candidatus Thiomargarita nelsonii]